LFQAKVEAKYNVKAQLVSSFIAAFLKVAWIFSGQGIIYLMGIYLLDGIMNIIFLWLIYWRNKGEAKSWRFDRGVFGHLLSSGWPLLLSGAAFFVLFKVDQVMIGKMLGEVQVGFYAAAAKLSEVWYFIPGILCTSLFPAIVNAKATGEALYRARLKNFYLLMAGLASTIILPVWLLAKPVILYLFGAEYLPAIPVLKIHIFSALGMFMSYAVTQYLVTENREKVVFFGNFLAMLVNVGLNFWLIPRLGIVGAAVATLVAYSVLPAYVWISERKRSRRINL
jgi:O-antigen/teichoic acid export membrane protein